jgi:hypothetical protein
VKRRAAVFAAAVVVLGSSGSAALAAGSPASPTASCVATITSYEASQLPPGAVGTEVSGLATSAPGFLGGLVSSLARVHDGSIEACFEAEG